MQGRLTRWAPLSGIVFAAAFLVALLLFADVPSADSADAKLTGYFLTHSHQLRLEVAFFGATIAVAFFFWFVGILAARVGSSVYARIVVASGTAAGIFFLAGLACDVALVSVADHSDAFRLDPNTARLLSDFAYPLTFETALPLAAPLVLAASLGGGFPGWLRRSGYFVALGCIVGFLGVPMALFLLWAVVVSVTISRGGHSASSPEPEGS